MSAERKAALSLMAVLGVFIVLAIVGLVGTFDRGLTTRLLTTSAMPTLKAQLAETPHDEALKEKIRQEDARIRADYFIGRRRFTWAAWALLAAAAAWVAAARWFVSSAPRRLPSVLEPGFAARRRRELAGAGRRAVWAAGSLTVALFAWMLWYGLFRQPSIPAASEAGAVATTSSVTPAPTGQAGTEGETPAPALSPFALRPSPFSWPGFRGPGNLGLAAEGKWPTAWSVGADGAPDRNIAWKTALPVDGKSSPIVWGDRVFVTGGDKSEQRILCFDLASGSILWNVVVQPPAAAADQEIEVMSDTGFAAPTPATDGTRVFALFATGLLAACDFDGKPVWTRSLGVAESTYGMASSPIVVGKLLVVQYDQGSDPAAGKSELLTFDTATGKPVSTVPREVPNSWSSPALIEVGGKPQIVTCAAPWVIAYDPVTGRELWKTDPLSGDVAPSPAFAGGIVYVTNTGAKTVALRPPVSGAAGKPEEVWTADEALPDTSSPVCDGKYLLMSGPGGDLTCWDAATGRKVWEHSLPSNVTASPIFAGGLVYIGLEDGSVAVVQPGDTYQEVSKNEMGEPLYATPAFVKDAIVVRGKSHLFRIEDKP